MLADRVNAAIRRVPVGPLYVLGFVPAATYLWLAVQDRLGADPLKVLEQEIGLIALQLLIAALAVTPLRDLTRINLLRFRRFLGLMAFYSAAMHFTIWLSLDRQFDWPRIVEDLTKRPFIMVGMAALALLVPLAATSNDAALRRLGGAAWRKLHRLAYPATALAAAHFVWLVKAWPLEPLLYAAGVAGLRLYRAWRARRRAVARAPVGGRA
jgi:sulfoxide reductase heme-binding subunit YedZ